MLIESVQYVQQIQKNKMDIISRTFGESGLSQPKVEQERMEASSKHGVAFASHRLSNQSHSFSKAHFGDIPRFVPKTPSLSNTNETSPSAGVCLCRLNSSISTCGELPVLWTGCILQLLYFLMLRTCSPESSSFKEARSLGKTNICSHENEHQNDVQVIRGHFMRTS